MEFDSVLKFGLRFTEDQQFQDLSSYRKLFRVIGNISHVIEYRKTCRFNLLSSGAWKDQFCVSFQYEGNL